MRQLLELRTLNSLQHAVLPVNGSFLSHVKTPAVSESRRHRPIVVLYTWLEAEKKHVHKYGDFYLRRGYDVLNVYSSARQSLRPGANGFIQVGGKVIDLLMSPGMRDRPIIVHAFSIGTYFYHKTVVHTNVGNFNNRIAAQVLDSTTDFWYMWGGWGLGASRYNLSRSLVFGTMKLYFGTFKSVAEPYIEGCLKFRHEHPVVAPSLFLHSRADPVGALSCVEGIVSSWRNELGYDVRTKCWEDSPHVQHARKHPEEYWTAVTELLEHCKV